MIPDDSMHMPDDDHRPLDDQAKQPARSAVLICRRCGTQFEPDAMEWLKRLILWLMLVGYVILRNLAHHHAALPTSHRLQATLLALVVIPGGIIAWKLRQCPYCKSYAVVPLKSRRGQHTLAHPPIYIASRYGSKGERMFTSGKAYAVAGALFLLLIIGMVIYARYLFDQG